MACSQSSQAAGGVHGKTSTGGHGAGCAGAGAGHRGHSVGRPALRAGRAAAGNVRRHAGGHGCCARRRASYCGQTSSSFAPQAGKANRGAAEVGWPTPCVDERRRGAQILGTVGEAHRRGWRAGCLAPACCAGPRAWATCGGFGGVSHAGAPRLAQGRPRHPTPQERSPCAGGMEKNSPKHWQPC